MEKKDNLEQFIVDHREAFDDKEPSPLLWLNIQKDLEGKVQRKKIRRLPKLVRIMAVAASFILILGVGMLIGLNLNQSNDNALVQSPEMLEFQEAEHYFQKQVNVKMNQLQGQQVDQDVQEDLTQLDAVYNEMRAELMGSTNKDNSAIVQAMIDNYRIRIEMLERILNNVNQKNQSHEENISL